MTAILDGALHHPHLGGHDLPAEPTDGRRRPVPAPTTCSVPRLRPAPAITLRMYAARKVGRTGSIRATTELDRTSANGKVESRFTLKVGLPEISTTTSAHACRRSPRTVRCTVP